MIPVKLTASLLAASRLAESWFASWIWNNAVAFGAWKDATEKVTDGSIMQTSALSSMPHNAMLWIMSGESINGLPICLK